MKPLEHVRRVVLGIASSALFRVAAGLGLFAGGQDLSWAESTLRMSEERVHAARDEKGRSREGRKRGRGAAGARDTRQQLRRRDEGGGTAGA
eukprot:1204104-Rhodomonas_salina.1